VFVQTRAEKERVHPTLAGRTLPPRAKASEGMAYNVVSNTVVDPSRLKTLEEAQANSALHRVRPAVESYMKAVGEAAEDRGLWPTQSRTHASVVSIVVAIITGVAAAAEVVCAHFLACARCWCRR
jgi:hypothetical protein